MFPVQFDCIRRVSFATKLFPKIKYPIKSTPTSGCEALTLTETSPGSVETNHSTRGTENEDSSIEGRSKNKDLLSFSGLIENFKETASFAQLPLFRRSIKKLTNLVENELEFLGAQEVLLPTLVPQRLWIQSKRLSRQQNALNNVYKLVEHKNDGPLILGPTFEESITQLIASMGGGGLNESELPLMIYQSTPKFRREPNPRFGLIRCNEFLMNDLYSFDANLEAATKTYDKVSSVYDKIFKRLGLNCIKAQSVTGDIGGKFSHEYQLPVSSGEDTTVQCCSCHSAFNQELYHDDQQLNIEECPSCGSKNIEKKSTIELAHVFLLSDLYSKPLNAKFSTSDGRRVNFEMGCYGLGLTRIIGAGVDLLSRVSIEPSDYSQIRWPNGVEPFQIGLIPPAKRSKQYQSGSTDAVKRITERILQTSNADILIEDRDKESIVKRLVKLRSLGIPHIIVVGQKFLDDPPQFELLNLESDKGSYSSSWFTEDQLVDYIQKLEVTRL